MTGGATLTKQQSASKYNISVRSVQRLKSEGSLEAIGVKSTDDVGRGNKVQFRWPEDIIGIKLSGNRVFIFYVDGTIKSIERRKIATRLI